MALDGGPVAGGRPTGLYRNERGPEGDHLVFHVLVNGAAVYPIASGSDSERLCGVLAGLPAFTAHATGPAGGSGPKLDVIVESGRGLVNFLDLARGVKLASRDPDCPDRDIVSLRNDSCPGLQFDQVEVERRDLIPAERAVAILRHFLATGEPTDLVPWPPDDWDDRPAAPGPQEQLGDDIPF